ncbi:hypothetical protein KBT16_13480 [Nostoc sp. CCCryo 231-06]|nr:hypothetical protein [Nostoc sp. CCCryo 231-06]
MAVFVKPENISLSGTNEASIKSHALLNALVNQQQEAVGLLKSTVSSIELSQISVDEYGTIVINNDAFREYVKGFILNPVRPAVDNGVCGINCAG